MTTILAFLLYSFVLLLSKLTRESIELSQRICEKPSKQVCPNCGSKHLIKNGSVHNSKPKYQCKSCSRQFVVALTKTTVSQETKQLINEVYIWLAIDRNSRKIVGCYIEDITKKSARKLWASLPEIYQLSTFAYTDFWQAYKTVVPHKHHRAVGKETGLTNHIERLNNTFRQRVSRLVRESLSFFKKMNNHVGAIWYFIHGYNAELDRI